MEEHPEMSLAIITPVKQGRLGKCDISNHNKRTIYNVHCFLKYISEQHEHFSNINVHKTKDITVKVCGVHRSTV
jgi:hypothetical protein